MTADYLSDEDAERMARAFWSDVLDTVAPEQIVRIRQAWAARPASARALDASCIEFVKDGCFEGVAAHMVMTDNASDRGDHLIAGKPA